MAGAVLGGRYTLLEQLDVQGEVETYRGADGEQKPVLIRIVRRPDPERIQALSAMAVSLRQAPALHVTPPREWAEEGEDLILVFRQ